MKFLISAPIAFILALVAPAQADGVKWYEQGVSGVAEYQGPHCSASCPEAIKIAEAVCLGRGKAVQIVKQCGCSKANEDDGFAQANFVCK